RCAVHYHAAHHLRAYRGRQPFRRPEDRLMSAAVQNLPVLGLMLGDCTGIGPEQCARILADRRLAATTRSRVIGDARVVAMGGRELGVEVRTLSSARPEDIDWTRAETPFIDLGNIDPARLARGQVSPESGKLTGDTLAFMIGLAQAGRIEAITFAPLNKMALHAGGWRFNDEHQMFAHLCGHTGFFGEMNVLDEVWVSRVTSHVSLRTALDQITGERIVNALTLADTTMRGAGFAEPRIAVASLNPHAGENGLFGREEIDVITPAVAAAAAHGIHCRGPFPADTVFIKAFAGEYDCVLTVDHDQGEHATQPKGFTRGVR